MDWRHNYKGCKWRDKFEGYRWHFWAWVMDNYPRFYKRINKIFPNFTLPF